MKVVMLHHTQLFQTKMCALDCSIIIYIQACFVCTHYSNLHAVNNQALCLYYPSKCRRVQWMNNKINRILRLNDAHKSISKHNANGNYGDCKNKLSRRETYNMVLMKTKNSPKWAQASCGLLPHAVHCYWCQHEWTQRTNLWAHPMVEVWGS